jgi:hypothetical protein
LIEEKEYEGHHKCMQNLHGLIVLVKPFPMVGGITWFLTVEEICPLKDGMFFKGSL